MVTVTPMKKHLCSKRGQALVELTLITPLMLLLVFGVVEIGSLISTYLTLTHTTREGANLTSRGEDPNDAIDAIKAAASPTIRANNSPQWRIIYTRIVQDPNVECTTAPCNYIVDDQITEGDLDQDSVLGTSKGTIINEKIDGVDSVKPNQIFHSIEVYYDYGPNVISFVGKGFNTLLYDRTIFTNVSAI